MPEVRTLYGQFVLVSYSFHTSAMLFCYCTDTVLMRPHPQPLSKGEGFLRPFKDWNN